MSVRIALLVLLLLVVGCVRPRSRAQGPFNRTPPTPNPTLLQGTPPATKAALAIDSPANPQPPAPPDQTAVVPRQMPSPEPASVTAPPASLPPATVPDSPVAAKLPAAPQQPPAATPTPGANDSDTLKSIARTAAERWKGIDTYEAFFARREVVGSKTSPTEEVQFLFRKQPMAVYMRNQGAAGRGREVLYNPTKFDDKLHVIVGEGDTKFLKAGTKAPSMSPDSPRVKAESRHSIRDVGFGSSIASFAKAVEANAQRPGTLKYAGKATRKEFGNTPLESVEQKLRPGEEERLTNGGVRLWFFDADPKSPAYGLPVLVTTFEGEREVEYYCFTAVRAPANLTDADFDVARLGKTR